jgi:hypothetical protein
MRADHDVAQITDMKRRVGVAAGVLDYDSLHACVIGVPEFLAGGLYQV